ncbi:MAG: sulfatase-like hydrolase/transferase [Planctomycetaceae bacterium]
MLRLNVRAPCLKIIVPWFGIIGGLVHAAGAAEAAELPNIILCMADDQGWGDTGYGGHPVLQTPHLDAMASGGLVFNRFYAASAQCSPTRASVLTGRHPYRYGIPAANHGRLPPEEICLAELLKNRGYTTGHFGKWHLGTLSTTDVSVNRGSGDTLRTFFSPPWKNGFDVCFSTESKVPTWDPMIGPAEYAPFWDPISDPARAHAFGTPYYQSDGSQATDDLRGVDSRIIMDRVLAFIRQAAGQQPFLAVVWFHAPHMPVVAGPDDTSRFPGEDRYHQHYYGCITALDREVGRLRNELRQLGVAHNTMFWYCSDNGPERKFGLGAGSTGSLRGHKRSLFEGGIRVPGILEWPAQVTAGRQTDIPVCTSDYLPTILDVLEMKIPDERPIDGISLVPLLQGRMQKRTDPIAFEFPTGERSAGSPPVALIENRYKLVSDLSAGGRDMLFDIVADPQETIDLSKERPEQVTGMKHVLAAWRASCRSSAAGEDYRD